MDEILYYKTKCLQFRCICLFYHYVILRYYYYSTLLCLEIYSAKSYLYGAVYS